MTEYNITRKRDVYCYDVILSKDIQIVFLLFVIIYSWNRDVYCLLHVEI